MDAAAAAVALSGTMMGDAPLRIEEAADAEKDMKRDKPVLRVKVTCLPPAALCMCLCAVCVAFSGWLGGSLGTFSCIVRSQVPALALSGSGMHAFLARLCAALQH